MEDVVLPELMTWPLTTGANVIEICAASWSSDVPGR